MKKLILLGFILTMTLLKASGQNPQPTTTPQLYVVKADDKTLFTDSNGISIKETDSNSKGLVYINPSWIDSMEIVKGKDATDKYGSRGQNGVLVMTLNKDGFDKMRETDREKFKR